jgi:RNA polymerase sigma-70 factor (ECF subfamily)
VTDPGTRDSLTFRRLFDAHAEALRRYAQRIVRSRETAEDLVQDVFLRLWRARDRVEIGPDTRAYLYVVTRSRALTHLRREQSEARTRAVSLPRGIASDEPALRPEGEAKVEADEITRAIEQVLERMPPRQREVAALRLRHQLPTAEIARRLGISPRTVEVHIARATKALREQLPALLPGEPRASRPPHSA